MSEAVPGTLRVGVLGPLDVRDADGRSLEVNGRKLRQLLGLLVLFRNTPLTPSRLVHELWGDDAPRSAEVTLRSHVSHLRRHLATASAGHLLTTGAAGYALALDPGQVDADEVETSVGEAQEALGLGHPDRSADLCRRALALWRGRPFAELEEVEAAEVEAGRLDELRLEALETLGTAELQRGRHREMVGELESWVAQSPFRERFTALLMLALYRSGRQTEALEAYARTRTRLGEELGLDPGPELQDLEQGILRQEPVLLEGVAMSSVSANPPVITSAPADAMLEAALRSPMVGRDVENARLASAWEDVASGGRRCLLLSGEAGIGKTRLVAELAHRVGSDHGVVLVGRCDGDAAPYHPVVDLLDSHPAAAEAESSSPDAVRQQLRLLHGPREQGEPSEAPHATEPRALYAAVTDVLGRIAAAAPTLVVVEDAEELDRSSSIMLRHVVAHHPPGLMLLVAYRDPPGGRHPALLELLGDVGTRGMTERLVLGRLDVEGVTGLLAAIRPDVEPELADRLWTHSGGNPYFASELARSLDPATLSAASWPVPTGVRDLLRHRLAALGQGSRQVVAAAAVVGREVDATVLTEMLDDPGDELSEALTELQRVGILVDSGRDGTATLAFPHDLMRDAVLADLDPLTRRALHHHAARALIAAGPGGRGASAIAVQLRLAGTQADPGEAATWSLRAAEEARELYAWDEAVEHGEGALTLVQQRAAASRDEPDHAMAVADAAVAVGQLRVLASRDLPRAVDLFEQALPIYGRAGDQATAGALHSRLGSLLSLHHSVMDVPRALEHFDAAERLMPEAGGLRGFHLHRGRSQAAMFGLRPRLGADAGTRAHELAESLGRRDLDVAVGWSRAWAAFDMGEVAAALQILESAWSVALELADPFLGWSPPNAGALINTTFLLDPATARAWCRRGLRQPRFTSLALPHTTVLDQLALALAESGELDTAREAVSALPPDAVSRRMLTFFDGHWEDAAQAWRSAVLGDEACGDRRNALINARWLSAALITLGDQETAVGELRALLRTSLEAPQVPTELYARARLVQLISASEPDEARDHLARCDQLLGGGEDWRGAAGLVEVGRAAVADAEGHRAASEASYGRAVELFARFRLPWLRAHALEEWAHAQARNGEQDSARATSLRAVGVYDAIGAAPRWKERVTALGS